MSVVVLNSFYLSTYTFFVVLVSSLNISYTNTTNNKCIIIFMLWFILNDYLDNL